MIINTFITTLVALCIKYKKLAAMTMIVMIKYYMHMIYNYDNK